MNTICNDIKEVKISIVGAGPGDIDLITVKGLKAIQSADVILYDALVNVELLKESKEGTVKKFVGKRAGQSSLQQDEINKLIVESAKEFGHCVRLKGGDPFVFGRGHEELVFIRTHQITTEIIPGISSAISLPLLQQVPITRRNVSESFWVLTGTTKQHILSLDIRLAIKSTATLVILMGIRKLRVIQDVLMSEDRTDTPVMVIESGSTKDEKVVVGTVKDIVDKVEANRIKSPGIIVIGEVVALHPEFVKDNVSQYECI